MSQDAGTETGDAQVGKLTRAVGRYVRGIIDNWPTRIKGGINWLSFLNIMEYTVDRIENDITLLPSLLNMF